MIAALALVFSLAASAPSSAPVQDFAALKAEAEVLYGQGSYALARGVYERARALELDEAQARWVDFRLADTAWRSAAATNDPDASVLDEARRRLEVLVRDVRREDQRDELWAEVHESLGDWSWRRNHADWSTAWERYSKALEWWAGSTELERARDRYLAITWKTTEYPGRPSSSGWYGVNTPDVVLENALRIAQRPEDQARAHWLRAMSLRDRGGDARALQRIPREFEAALAGGRELEFYDDALYYHALWLEDRGRVQVQPDGQWSQVPDYVGALVLYRRLVREFEKGQTRWHDDARRRDEKITRSTLAISVSNHFLPGSEVSFRLEWRNVERVDFKLYAVDLLRDLELEPDVDHNYFVNKLSVAGREPVRRWTHATGDEGLHQPGREGLRVEGRLPLGAYVLEATAGGRTARDLVLVTDAALVLEVASDRALAWFVDAETGAPLGEAKLELWERSHPERSWVWREQRADSAADGTAVFELTDARHHRQILGLAKLGERTAFALSNARSTYDRGQAWRVQAVTDRPAYRPEETASIKVTARRFDGERYSTPGRQGLKYRITGPQGDEVATGELALNDFGSANAELAFDAKMTLGEYHITFMEQESGRSIGSAPLLRLEEYKLPEFRVGVRPLPREDGGSYRLGDRVEAELSAEYYFGGAVAGAACEVVVSRTPHWVRWEEPREFPWYFEGRGSQYPWSRGGSSIVERLQVTTDAEGKARVAFDTPPDSRSDYQYVIEARVRDASRREIVGQGSVVVARQGYYVFPRALHNIHRPGEPIEVRFKTVDADAQGRPAEGLVEVYREVFKELWVLPDGRRLSGEEKHRLGSDAAGLRLEHRGYERELFVARPLTTDEDGEGQFRFTPAAAGVYQVVWKGRDADGLPITAEVQVWALDEHTTDLGWHRGELEVIVDRESFREGEEAVVMLSAAQSGAWALFTVESERLLHWQVVQLTGNAKLLRVPLDERHVPNTYFSARSVRGGRLWADFEEVIVPPTKHFLTVEVEPDAAEVRPGEEREFTLRTLDHQGRPVSAEVSLGVIDESVLAIQSEYASDPRQFFYGDKRPRWIDDGASFFYRSYVRLVEDDKGELVDRRQARRDESEREGEYYEGDAGVRSGSDDFFLGQKKESRQRGGRLTDMPAGAPAEEMAGLAALGYAGGKNPGGGGQPVTVRSDFRSTALWAPEVVTDETGRARVSLTYPESLTGWKATARAATAGSDFGLGTAGTRTRLPLTVRLQAPRFFVVGDQCTISALINNNGEQALSVSPALVFGTELARELTDGISGRAVKVPAGGEVRVDWRLAFDAPGELELEVAARADEVADAMRKTFLVHEHGIDKLEAVTGRLDGSGTVQLELPAERRAGSTELVVQLAPSMAVTMLDALPYLVHYPYGCVEQTLSRFLPTLVVKKTLTERGLDVEDVLARAFGGIEPSSAARTHPKGGHLARLDEVTAQSLKRLVDFQHADGGWGWWKSGDSDRFMTAYVVWGLSLARESGLDLPDVVLGRGAEFLDVNLVEAEDEPELAAWMLHALGAWRRVGADRRPPSGFQRKALGRLWGQRDGLGAYGRALFALAAKDLGDASKAELLVDNLVNGVKLDRTPDVSVVREGAQASHGAVEATAHWGADGTWRRWSDGPVETTSMVLRALLAIRPDHELVAPTTTWLIRNRRGAQWNNTRDTALAVLALNDYLEASGELAGELQVELLVNGTAVRTYTVSSGEALTAPSRFVIDPELVRDGLNRVELRRTRGDGPLYFSVQARYFSLEEPVRSAGHEVFLRREYFKVTQRATLLDGFREELVPLAPGDTLASGQRVEVVLTVEAKNDLEYLIFEDRKPAGLEAVDLKSGGGVSFRQLRADGLANRMAGASLPGQSEDATGRSRQAHRELRDRMVALFVDRLEQGVWEARYTLRAEVPGTFHALPVVAQAMYVPEIRGNGTEVLVQVVD